MRGNVLKSICIGKDFPALSSIASYFQSNAENTNSRFSHNVTAAMLVPLNKQTAAMLVPFSLVFAEKHGC